MNTVETTKEAYLRSIRKLLSGHPTELEIFEGLWKAEKHREAYLMADDAIRRFGLVLTQQAKKVDEEFYWAVVN